MADKYLLACPQCGNRTAVETHQAGSSIPCACGAPIAVPGMREISRLEKVQAAAGPARSTWGPRQAVSLVGLVLLLASLAPCGYWLANWPAPPVRDVPAAIGRAQEAMAKIPLDQTWLYWLEEVEYRGLAVSYDAEKEAHEQVVGRLRIKLAACVAVAILGAVLLFAPLGRRS